MTFDPNNLDLLEIRFSSTDEHQKLLANIHKLKIVVAEKGLSIDSQIISNGMQKAYNHVYQAAKGGKSFSKEDICAIHKLIGLDGKFRTPEQPIAVWFGTDYPYFPPDANDLSTLMEKYENRCASLDKMKKSLQEICVAYFLFQLIHPFSDGNGRTGRLICIWLMLQNNYEFLAPFIEKRWAGDHDHRIKIFQSSNNNYLGCLMNSNDLDAHFSVFYLYFLKEIKDFLEKIVKK